MPKVLITGEQGYMAKNLINSLSKFGFEQVKTPELNEDNTYQGWRQNVELDAANTSAMLLWVADTKPDLVVHCAALVGSERGNTYQASSVRSNLDTTVSVMDACQFFHVPLVYISSSAVYAEWADKPLSEKSPIEPLNFYNVTKLAGELLIRGRFNKPWFVIRPAMGFGNHEDNFVGYPHSTLDKLILSRKGKWHEPFKIMLNPGFRKPYVLMSEMCDVMAELINKFPAREIVNVASPHAPLFKEFLDELGIPKNASYRPEEDFLQDHIFTTDKLTKLLGYKWNPKPALEYLKEIL